MKTITESAKFRRACEGLLHGPSKAVKSIADQGRFYAESQRPVGDAQSYSVMYQHAVAPRVSHLNRLRRPAHVAWLIVTVVVDAFKRCSSWRPRTNIGKEVREVVPTVANTNTSVAVTTKRWVASIQAALSHGLPDLVFVCHVAMACCAMFQVSLSDQTATTATFSREQLPGPRDLFFAADTQAPPVQGASIRSMVQFAHREAAERLTSQVEVFPVYRGLSHAGSSIQGICVVRGLRPLARSLASSDFTPISLMERPCA